MVILKISCVFFLCLSFVFYLPDNETIEPPYTYYSYTITLVKLTRAKPAFRRRLLYWVAYLILPIVQWGLQRLEPLIASDNWNLQPPLELWQDPLVKEYEQIFNSFDFSVLPVPKRGPKRNTLEV